MITYNAGRFEVLPDDYWSKDPMTRGPLVWNGVPTVFTKLIKKKRWIGMTEMDKWLSVYKMKDDGNLSWNIMTNSKALINFSHPITSDFSTLTQKTSWAIPKCYLTTLPRQRFFEFFNCGFIE